MKKIIAALIVSTFAVGAFAQSAPSATSTAPAASVAKKDTAVKKHTSTKKHAKKHAKTTKAA